MVETAENLAEQYGLSRESVRTRTRLGSHQNAPSPPPRAVKFRRRRDRSRSKFRRGSGDADPRSPPTKDPASDTSLEKLARLRRAFRKGGTVTAGNASSQNDAAAMCLVVAEDKLAELNLEPLAFLRGWAVAGCHPATMGIGPVPAVARLFERAGLSWDDVDLVELNEAFAAQVLAVLAEWPDDVMERLNVNGSGISLGHPIAATGARILTTLLYEMKRRGSSVGLETMCIGGGQGLAAAFEAA